MRILFLTPVPSFYKNLLFKELSLKAEVKTFFTNRSAIKRDTNFYAYLDINLNLKITEKASFFTQLVILVREAKKADKIYYGGWDDIMYWILIFLLPIYKNGVIIESSIYEYRIDSVKSKFLNFAKRAFLKRISTCIVSGSPQYQLIKKIGFSKTIYHSNSVGILDFKYPPLIKKVKVDKITKFLFIGRVGFSKGSDFLLKIFPKIKNTELHIVGELENDNFLREDSKNIFFHGYKQRHELKDIFCMLDVLILPSRIEPWGLVVEEALYHGLPVLVSNKVGCRVDIVEYYNVGTVFDIDSIDDFTKKINELCDSNFYNFLIRNISKIDFTQRRKDYCNTFLNE